jgi:hypothetical protein
MMSDKYNPKHYVSDPSGVECIEISEHRNFNIGNVIKYVWRAGLKDGEKNTDDLKKAIWYLNREIARLEKLDNPSNDTPGYSADPHEESTRPGNAEYAGVIELELEHDDG